MAAPSSTSSTRQSSLRRAAAATTTAAAATAAPEPSRLGPGTAGTSSARGRRGRSPDPSQHQQRVPRKRPRATAAATAASGPRANEPSKDTEEEDDDALLQENAKRAKTVQYPMRPKANGARAGPRRTSGGSGGGGGGGGGGDSAHLSRDSSAAGASAARMARGRVAKAAQPPPSGSVAEPGGAAARRENGTQTKDKEGQQPKRIELVIEDAPEPAAAGAAPVNGAPAGAATAAEKRTLRSQDGGSRTKSELSLYFPNYDEFISNEPREEELLKAETRLFITEDASSKSPSAANKSVQVPPEKVTPRKRRASTTLGAPPATPRTPATAAASSSSAAAALTTYRKLDFSANMAKLARTGPHPDPLTQELYAAAHRRSERQEKQLRNIEKERAQHEKVQLERLYDGLRGPDWLRVMGISGVTESERKGWEGKRTYFVKEVGALLEKFRLWREEERRRKVEKELHDKEAEESEEPVEADEGEEEEEGDEEEEGGEDDAEVEEDEDDQGDGTEDRSPHKTPQHKRSPASSDVDAMAAEQLHAEALLSSTSTKHPPLSLPSTPSTPKSGIRRRKETGIALPDVDPTQPEKPMTSFFAKTHQRDAAMKNSKRNARTQYAFGQPIPELSENSFDLPDDYLTADAKKASARSRRRAKRKGRDE